MKLILGLCGAILSGQLYATDDITGLWQQIDDTTGTAKSWIQISKDKNGNYSGKIVKITARTGSITRVKCNNCPAPYTDQPILGLKLLTNLQAKADSFYDHGRIIDPMTGRTYDAQIELQNSGQSLRLRAYIGFKVLGRSQTWIRIKS